MVDCGKQRCAQERRVFKKELLSWSKKVPLIIGLEEVAKQVLGKKKIELLLTPFNDLETHVETDFEPSSQCSFCDVDSSLNSSTEPDSLTEDEQEAATFRFLQSLVPFSYPPRLLESSCDVYEEAVPLDLSASTNQRAGHMPGSASPKPPTTLKVPQIFANKSKRKDSWKRAYTDEELSAALNDIRTGKLGTRRAAVLYGIPRSTLRNKIYKVDGEEVMNGFDPQLLQENKLCMGDLLQGGMGFYGMPPFAFRDDHLSPLAEIDWERKLEHIRRKHNLLEPNRKFGVTPLCGFDGDEEDERERDWRFMMGPYMNNNFRMPFLPELVRRMAEERMEHDRLQRLHMERLQAEEQQEELDLRTHVKRESSPLGEPHSSNNSHGSSSPPVELKIPSYKPIKPLFGEHGFPVGLGDSPPLPGFPPNAHQHPSSAFKIGETLKDIIAKTIAEKVRSRVHINHEEGMPDMNRANFETMFPMPNGMPDPPPKKRKSETPEKQPSSTTDAPKKPEVKPDGTVKKTRPKRGQYRKYNSQLLLEAVRAVQRGEMSVHRAGSYFGVPHSTLEYKVKERHLLRQRKPRENRKKTGDPTATSNAVSSTEVSTSVSSTNGNSSSNSNGGLAGPAMSVPQQATAMSTMAALAHQSNLAAGMGFPAPFPMALAWAQPSAMPFPGAPDPTMAAYPPPAFGLNTSASELLKKLQQKVQAKNAMACPEESELASIMRGSPISDGLRRSPISDGLRRSPISDGLRRSPISEGLQRSPISDGLRRSPVNDRMRRSPINDQIRQSPVSEQMRQSPIKEQLGPSPAPDTLPVAAQ